MTTTTKTETKRTFKCPKCHREFSAGPGLGSHLRTVHGIIGTSKSTLSYRKKQKQANDTAKAADVPSRSPDPQIVAGNTKPAVSPAALDCPECKAEGITASFSDAKNLGRHRRFKHGVIGRSAVKAALRVTAGAGSFNTERTLVPYAGRTQNQLTTIRNHEEIQNGFAIDPIALALAVGNLEEFCRHFAQEHDVPARQFTRHVAQLLLRQAGR